MHRPACPPERGHDPPLATRLRRALGIEALVGIVVLALTASLLALSPPGLAASGVGNLALQPEHSFANPALEPSPHSFTERVGTNEVHIEVIELWAWWASAWTSAGHGTNGWDDHRPHPAHGAGRGGAARERPVRARHAGTWKVVVKMNGVEVGSEDVYVSDLAALDTPRPPLSLVGLTDQLKGTGAATAAGRTCTTR